MPTALEDHPPDNGLNPVQTALERLAADGYGKDGFDEAGARDGYGRPLVKAPDDMAAPPKPMQRPSTRAKALDDMQGLIRWKGGMVARGAAMYPELVAKLADVDMGDPSDRKWLYGQAEKLAEMAGSTEGADYGSLVHALCEAWVQGADWRSYLVGLEDIEEVLTRAVEAVQQALDDAAIAVIESEVCVVNEAQGTAGSTDGLGRRNGRSAIFDIKTTKPRSLRDSWLSFLVQTRLYSTSECLYDPATGHRRRFPDDFDRDSAWVVHSDWRAGRCTIYELDLSRIDEAIELANEVARWRAEAEQFVTPLEIDSEQLIAQMERSVEAIEARKVTEADVRAAEVDAEMQQLVDEDGEPVSMDERLAETEASWLQLAAEADERIVTQPPPPEPPPIVVPDSGSLLNFVRARAAELIAAGHGDDVLAAFTEHDLAPIGEKAIEEFGRYPTERELNRIADVLEGIEKKVGRWVDDAEVARYRKAYDALPDKAAHAFTEWLRSTGWNPNHRFTRDRAAAVAAKLYDLANGSSAASAGRRSV